MNSWVYDGLKIKTQKALKFVINSVHLSDDQNICEQVMDIVLRSIIWLSSSLQYSYDKQIDYLNYDDFLQFQDFTVYVDFDVTSTKKTWIFNYAFLGNVVSAIH